MHSTQYSTHTCKCAWLERRENRRQQQQKHKTKHQRIYADRKEWKKRHTIGNIFHFAIDVLTHRTQSVCCSQINRFSYYSHKKKPHQEKTHIQVKDKKHIFPLLKCCEWILCIFNDFYLKKKNKRNTTRTYRHDRRWRNKTVSF